MSDLPADPALPRQGLPTGPTPTPAPGPASTQPKQPGTDWWGEIKGIFWLVVAVLGFHSLVAKPFYIPSESMMPTLIKGDRLVVSKFPYGWSYVSPSFHVLPFIPGRLFGHEPQRGDVVIIKPPEADSDYIKRVIGLPGDTLAVRDGQLWLNGKPVPKVRQPDAMIPVDANVPCDQEQLEGRKVAGPDGKLYCRLPVFRETLPNGVSYDTIDLGDSIGDNYGPVVVPPHRIFLMGDNRDQSADSRFPTDEQGLGGPLPWENLGGRAEFITFSLDGSSQIWNPLSWFTALRHGRAGISLHPAHDPAK